MRRLNVVYIVADDLGYADLGCYGARPSATGLVSPVLDRLASGGLRFTQGYANSPVCSPTRFALMTMRYQYRLRGAAEEPITGTARDSDCLGLPPEHPTLPSLLRDAGWRTALVGKWHLGYPPRFGPTRAGYEEFFGSISGAVDYFTHCDTDGVHDLFRNRQEHVEDGYLTDLLSHRAVDYIRRMAMQDAPFFLSLHYTAPHWPWETREDRHRSARLHGALADLQGGSVRTYQRMITQMDEGIGAVAAELDAHGMLQDTLILFTSDNGGERYSDTWPLVGGKMDLTEGGIRVPWIAHWPRVVPPGSVSGQLCMTMDFSATVLAEAGVPPDAGYAPDGVSLSPILRDPMHCFPRTLYWRTKERGQRAIREGRWKYLRVDGRDYLFDLAVDERERANLVQEQPAKLAEMCSQWEAWNRTMPEIPPDAGVRLPYSLADMPSR
ncbi:sulfatase [Ramlibacter algicola]|uniref:Sulfatase-like hydrolase/transferase n=1 Tax=Ramlibacter algicola TaxID=2795217 RepID=A0A934Q0W5_9BURK|nr:sulfatase-like hydrolase/transferase [Ramlibacter algicola]MBK0392703.1 sulfatase-like hydrolase/transferase [Ramlibacter algicola]